MLNFEEYANSRLNNDDRIIVLEIIDGEKAKTSTGLIDPRIFKGENNLHVICDKRTMLWSFKYDQGAVPPALKNQKFTRFSDALRYVEEYFKTRNIRVKEVIS